MHCLHLGLAGDCTAVQEAGLILAVSAQVSPDCPGIEHGLCSCEGLGDDHNKRLLLGKPIQCSCHIDWIHVGQKPDCPPLGPCSSLWFRPAQPRAVKWTCLWLETMTQGVWKALTQLRDGEALAGKFVLRQGHLQKATAHGKRPDQDSV